MNLRVQNILYKPHIKCYILTKEVFHHEKTEIYFKMKIFTGKNDFSITKFMALIRIIWRGHIRLLAVKKENWDKVHTFTEHAIIPKIFYNQCKHVLNEIPTTTPINNDTNEKIFTVWLQGEESAPPIVTACLNSMRRHCKQDVIILSDKTLGNYIDLPGYIMDKRKNMTHAHFSDIARMELLHNHGGIWIDATDYVTAPIPDWVIGEDFFIFLAGKNINPLSFVQSCFIRARRNGYLLNAWRALILEYWKHNNMIFDYFTLHLLFKTMIVGDSVSNEMFECDPRAVAEFAKMPHIDQDLTHGLWDYLDKPFDKNFFDEITKKTFFQKTTYKKAAGINPTPGTFADVMINGTPM